MKRTIGQQNGSVVPLAKQPLLDTSGQITPSGRRRSDRLMDHTMERLQREAAGEPEPIAHVLPFRRQRG